VFERERVKERERKRVCGYVFGRKNSANERKKESMCVFERERVKAREKRECVGVCLREKE